MLVITFEDMALKFFGVKLECVTMSDFRLCHCERNLIN